MIGPGITKERLDALRLSGMTRDQMAAELGVTLGAIKRAIAALGVIPVPTSASAAAKKPKNPESNRRMPVDDGVSLMDRCKQILGKRMGEDARGYLLDGRPASSMQVVKAAGLSLGKQRKPERPT